METVHLIGAEDVRSAGNTISGAADEMKRAAGNIDYALQQHQRFMDDWLQRFEAVVDKLAEAKQPQQPLSIFEQVFGRKG